MSPRRHRHKSIISAVPTQLLFVPTTNTMNTAIKYNVYKEFPAENAERVYYQNVITLSEK